MSRPAPLLVDGPLRLRQCRDGRMLFYATDQWVGRPLELYGEAHGLELDFLLQGLKPGQTIVDVGANIGAHTLGFARAVGPTGRVIAIEAQRPAFQLLCANLALNGVRHVEAIHAAAGAAVGRIAVPVLDYRQPGNYGGVALGGEAAGESEAVEVRPLDALALPSCRLIKIDAEGMEAEVIVGATATIARHRPALYVENDREERSPALVRLISDLGYRLFWHLPPMFNPRNHAGRVENELGRVVAVNMLCVPRDRGMRIDGLREVAGPEETWRNVLNR